MLGGWFIAFGGDLSQCKYLHRRHVIETWNNVIIVLIVWKKFGSSECVTFIFIQTLPRQCEITLSTTDDYGGLSLKNENPFSQARCSMATWPPSAANRVATLKSYEQTRDYLSLFHYNIGPEQKCRAGSSNGTFFFTVSQFPFKNHTHYSWNCAWLKFDEHYKHAAHIHHWTKSTEKYILLNTCETLL